MMEYADVMLVINPAPLWAIGGIVGAFILLQLILYIRNRTANRETDDEYAANLDSGPRREAMELIEELGAVRDRMLELNRALTQRQEGVRWRFGIGDNADRGFRDADADSAIDRFLSDATERDLSAAQGEMISLFRDAAHWLEKYAPQEVPPPSFSKIDCELSFSDYFRH